MTDITPSGDEIVFAYVRDAASIIVKNGTLVDENIHESDAEVRRGIAKIQADAWDEGFSKGWDRGHYESGDESNPYR